MYYVKLSTYKQGSFKNQRDLSNSNFKCLFRIFTQWLHYKERFKYWETGGEYDELYLWLDLYRIFVLK